MSDPVLIWSFEHDAWWAPRELGYTRDVNKAGHYERGRAEEICRRANYGGATNEEIRELAAAPLETQAARDLPEVQAHYATCTKGPGRCLLCTLALLSGYG